MTGLLSPSLLEPSDHFYKPSGKKPRPIFIGSPISFPRLPNSRAYWRESTGEETTNESNDKSRISYHVQVYSKKPSLLKPLTGEEERIYQMLISRLRKSCEKTLDYSTFGQ